MLVSLPLQPPLEPCLDHLEPCLQLFLDHGEVVIDREINIRSICCDLQDGNTSVHDAHKHLFHDVSTSSFSTKSKEGWNVLIRPHKYDGSRRTEYNGTAGVFQ